MHTLKYITIFKKMKLVVLKEVNPKEKRIAITPEIVKKLKRIDVNIEIEKDIGQILNITNEEFIEAGAKINSSRKDLLSTCDILWSVDTISKEDISFLKKRQIYLSLLNPFEKKNFQDMIEKEILAFSMMQMPRTTLCQKMDVISSQANLAGYSAVILAANHFKKILPMMSTPGGTIKPASVFVIGAGVAGLQAIATAKRLGAKVEAFDTRAITEEQVKSLGAKFVKIEKVKSDETEQGYAKELTKDDLEMQKNAMIEVLKRSDIVITTAQVFGKKAPILITKEMLKFLKEGSIIVDMAVSSGGNVEGSEDEKIIQIDGKTILGFSTLSNQVAFDASFMFSSNLFNFFSHFWDKEKKEFKINLEDEILKNCLIR